MSNSIKLYLLPGFALHHDWQIPMMSLQCNGTHLPSDVSSLMSISIERQPTQPGDTAYVLAYLTATGRYLTGFDRHFWADP